jgi:hypothetical protein
MATLFLKNKIKIIMDNNELQNFIKKNRIEKKKYILDLSQEIKVPKTITKKLHQAYRYKEVLNKFIEVYLSKIKSELPKELNLKISEKINLFKNDYITRVLPLKIKETPTNLYQMSGAIDFAKINLILRSLSTCMGRLWEDIADCSMLTISTEKEFDIKINGTDIIFVKEKKIFYAQIKTLEGTLTGSQVPRSIEELSIHKNSYFVAAFETGTDWTFNSDKIQRLKGKEFWSLIELDYDHILNEVKKMIKDVENAYYKMKSIKSLDPTN